MLKSPFQPRAFDGVVEERYVRPGSERRPNADHDEANHEDDVARGEYEQDDAHATDERAHENAPLAAKAVGKEARGQFRGDTGEVERSHEYHEAGEGDAAV